MGKWIGGSRTLNRPRSQRGALPLSYDPRIEILARSVLLLTAYRLPLTAQTQGWRDSNPQSPSGRLIENQAAFTVCIHPQKCARKDSNFQLAGFEPAASTRWATRARRDAGGGSRTRNDRFLRTARLPGCATPALTVSAGGGSRTRKRACSPQTPQACASASSATPA